MIASRESIMYFWPAAPGALDSAGVGKSKLLAPGDAKAASAKPQSGRPRFDATAISGSSACQGLLLDTLSNVTIGATPFTGWPQSSVGARVYEYALYETRLPTMITVPPMLASPAGLYATAVGSSARATNAPERPAARAPSAPP